MPRHTNAVGKTRPIRVDEEVYEWLQSLAEPLKDTPNDVLRRLMTNEINKRAPFTSRSHMDKGGHNA